MNQGTDFPSEEAVRAVLAAVDPGWSLQTVLPLAGSFSNHTHLIEARSASGELERLVIRRYAEAGGHQARKAQVEFRALALLQGHDIPAPQPLVLDGDGALLGSPGIVTSFVPGCQIMAADDPPAWAVVCTNTARMLARIHAVPCDEQAQAFLLDANAEVVWFLKYGEPPGYMQAHPDGAMVWNAVHDLLPGIQFAPSTLVHIDYWCGNILWENGQMSAVVDWEEAAYGDPGYDVAYCRMEMYIEGLDAAADSFLRTYESARGQPVTNLGFWELAASVRTMTHLETSLRTPVMHARFRQFIARARQRAGY